MHIPFRLLILIGCFLFPKFSAAQQIPLYSLYEFNPFIYNPAYTGSEDQTSILFSYRKQWVDFEGAPDTRTLSFETSLGKKRFGLGLYLYNDVNSIFRRNAGYASYAYHIRFNDHHRLSLGIGAGVQENRIDFERVVVRNRNDRLLANNRESAVTFDASAGIQYFIKGFHLGFSVPQIVETDLRYLNTRDEMGYSLARHYLVQTGYRKSIWENRLTLHPQAMFRITDGRAFQVDAGASVWYKNYAWVGAMYRYQYAATMAGGFRVHDMVTVAYAYDLAVHAIKPYAGGTHEIMIGLTIGKKKTADLEALQQKIDSLNQAILNQDSLLQKLEEKVDSLHMEQDSLIKGLRMELDSLKKMFEAGLTIDMPADMLPTGNATIDSLLQAMRDMQRRFSDSLSLVRQQNGGDGKSQQQQQIGTDGRIQNSDANRSNNANQNGRLPSNVPSETLDDDRTRIMDESEIDYIAGEFLGDFALVVGSFKIRENAINYRQSLTKQGFKTGVVYNNVRNWYYVYFPQPDDKTLGIEEFYRIRETNANLKDAWIIVIRK